ncbi:hypothetical protein C8J56DRAFT_1039651 [Mycena floridula]|nr:hypothetical protein C8J56DRAFT_1039651 [Mycena floridula]
MKHYQDEAYQTCKANSSTQASNSRFPLSTAATTGSSQPRQNGRFARLPMTWTDNRAMNATHNDERQDHTSRPSPAVNRGGQHNSRMLMTCTNGIAGPSRPVQDASGAAKPFDMKTAKCFNCGFRAMEPELVNEHSAQIDDDDELEYMDESEEHIVIDDHSDESSEGEEKEFVDESDYGPVNPDDPSSRALLTWVAQTAEYHGPMITPVIDQYTNDLYARLAQGQEFLTWDEIFPEMSGDDVPTGPNALEYWDGHDSNAFLRANYDDIMNSNADATADDHGLLRPVDMSQYKRAEPSLQHREESEGEDYSSEDDLGYLSPVVDSGIGTPVESDPWASDSDPEITSPWSYDEGVYNMVMNQIVNDDGDPDWVTSDEDSDNDEIRPWSTYEGYNVDLSGLDDPNLIVYSDDVIRYARLWVVDDQSTSESTSDSPQLCRIKVSSEKMNRPVRNAGQTRCLTAMIEINGMKAYTLFDSGSSTDSLSPEFTRVSRTKVHELSESLNVQLGTMGSCSKINFGMNATVVFGGETTGKYFDVFNIDRYDAIVGSVFMRKHKVALDFEYNVICCCGKVQLTMSLKEDVIEQARRSAAWIADKIVAMKPTTDSKLKGKPI